MKRVHIVEPYHSTAMRLHAEPLMQTLPGIYEVTTSEDIDYRADVNLHIPWHTLVGKEKGDSKHIVVYTHINPPDVAKLIEVCEKADLVTALSFKGRSELVKLGIDPRKIWVIPCAADQYKYRKRLIGVVGYPQPNGRKREHLLLDMAWKYNLSPYEFLLVGGGWDEFANRLASLGVALQAFHAERYEAINEIYGRMDALLVTGYAEGGPLPVLEAMMTGTKIFSPRFGYAADLLTEDDIYSDLPDLMNKLEKFFEKSTSNHLLARTWVWQDYAAEYGLMIGRLLGESVDSFPERGTSRYAQLLDVVDEVKPQGIVEIGTWKGDRAVQMIQQAAKYRPIQQIGYQGFDLFASQTLEDYHRELSKFGWRRDIVERRLNATGAKIELVEGYTVDTLARMSRTSQLYFVDGGHSEETIQNDSSYVLDALGDSVAVFDDYYHSGKPEGMGCNKVIDSLDRSIFEVVHLPARTLADDGREIGMVKVRKHADIRIQMPEKSYSGGFINYSASSSGIPDQLCTS